MASGPSELDDAAGETHVIMWIVCPVKKEEETSSVKSDIHFQITMISRHTIFSTG